VVQATTWIAIKKNHLQYNGSIYNVACHQEEPFPVDRHKLTYHKLKKHICERNKCNYTSVTDNRTNKRPKITYHRLNQTLRSANNKKQQATTGYSHVGKKDAKKIYMKQIEDTPRIICAICEELHFAKNIKCFTNDLEK
jgi:hypothetical protein